MEAAFGADFSGVRVHSSSTHATALGALAYTQGNEIHVAPGQWAPETRQGQELLGHELAHVIQQREGRVQATAQYKDVALNDEAGLEAEADALGARAAQGLSATRSQAVSSSVAHVGPSAPAQLKSMLKTVTPKKASAETPIETLHKVFGKYYQSQAKAPVFDFHSLRNVQSSTYVATTDARGGSTYDKAGEVVAEIDPLSSSKANSKLRDNSVILPYGHFGVMERALFGRRDLGNTYDGGHLVEHTLMEGVDADVHGNIAPQENKHFNQGLMRGWEKTPEDVMTRDKQTFTYTMKVEYSNDTYERTGKQIVDAGVIPQLFFQGLPPRGANSQDALEKESVTFERWVPYQWTGKIDVGTGKTIALRGLPNGANLANLQPTAQMAHGIVVDTSTLTMHTATPSATPAVAPLHRQNSGFLAGAIDGAVFSPQRVMVGGNQTLGVEMYQPEPQDIRDQPTGPLPGAAVGAPVVVPTNTAAPNITAKILSNPVDFYQMQQELSGVALLSKGKRKADNTIESEASKASPEYKKFKAELGTAGVASNTEQRASFIRVFKAFDPTTHLTYANVTSIIDKSSFPAATRSRLHPIVHDPNLKL
ncbi:hypothetical protein A7982_13843 [Minicystis rosea]|nr:hypothetical protein A7982_13843 [Minicystis rosea]